MRKLRFIYLIGIFLFVISSCDKMDELIVDTPESSTNLKSFAGCNDSPEIFELIAGKNHNVGKVTVDNDQENLYVTYETVDDWLIGEVHIYVGLEADVPLNKKGTPVPGHFPYSDEELNLSAYTYVIPLSYLEGLECFAVIAHAVVFKEEMIEGEMIETDEETAWGCGDKNFKETFGTTRWGCFGDYCLVDCIEEEKYLTFKTWTPNFERFGILMDGEKLFTSEWCWNLGIVIPEDGDSYDIFLSGTNTVFAVGHVSFIGNNLILNISTIDGTKLYKTYWFYGTKTELAAYSDGNCPKYGNWPDPVIEEATTHEIVIPL